MKKKLNVGHEFWPGVDSVVNLNSLNWKKLESWSKIAVLWWWPAWSFFSYHVRRLLRDIWLDVQVDIFEPKYFPNMWPAWCNKCWWVVSSSFVKEMKKDWIIIPDSIMRRPILEYVLHTSYDKLSVQWRINSSAFSVHRWWWPRFSIWWDEKSFDEHLLQLARAAWARVISEEVKGLVRDSYWKIKVLTSLRWEESRSYDMTIWAFWVNSKLLLSDFFKNECNYILPKSEKWSISELKLWEKQVVKLGNKMHIFVTNIPEIKLAAIIPKKDYASLILIWDQVNRKVRERFLSLPEVKKFLPNAFKQEKDTCCWCRPSLTIWSAKFDYWAWIAFTWDCAVSRLYKDGIWTSYRVSKALARTIVNHWIDEKSLSLGEYWELLRNQEFDNKIWENIFILLDKVRRVGLMRKLLTLAPKVDSVSPTHFSDIYWNLFSWDTSYANIKKQMFTLGIDIGNTNINRIRKMLQWLK